MQDIKYLKRILDENKSIRISDYLTERFKGGYDYDEYILNINELILYRNGREVFRIKLKEICYFSGNKIEI